MKTLKQLGSKTYYIDDITKVGIYKLNETDVCLIDSGNNKESAREIDVIFKKNNFNVKYIINTHSHTDHISGNHYFEERYDVTILASKEEKHMIDSPILEPASLYGAKPFKMLLNKYLYAESSTATIITSKNVPKGLKILELPGHSISMIGVATDDNICFLGDALASEYLLNKHKIFYIFDVEKYLETLEYMKTFKYKKYILSHGEELDNLEKIINLNKEAIEKIKNEIINICIIPHTYEKILKEIFTRFEITMNPLQYYLIGTTVKSFISYLIDLGELEMYTEDNELYYKTIS